MTQPASICRRALWVLLLAGLVIARMLAQTPGQPSGGSLSGLVLDGSTGQPVIGSQVMLDPTGTVGIRGNGERFDMRTGRTALTDADGAWTFLDIAPGSHRVEASKFGYRPGFANGITPLTFMGEPLQIASGENRTGVVMRMWRTGAISGKVRLTSGAPFPRQNLTAMRLTSGCGVDHLLSSATTITDDRGAYQFPDLPPGDYTIGTMPVQGSTMASGPFPTTYYPGVVDPAVSRTITLSGGDERTDVNIQVPIIGSSVKGRVLLADGSAAGDNWAVDLWSSSSTPVVERPIARTFTDSAGRYQFQNVPPGGYVARVVQLPPVPDRGIHQTANGFSVTAPAKGHPLPPMTDAPTWWGESQLAVTDQSADTTVRLQEGWRIQGRVTFDATDPPLPASLESMPMLTNRSDGFSVGGFGDAFQSGRVETDGRFTTVAFPPGRYLLSVLLAIPNATPQPTNLSLEAIRLGGRDVTGSAIELNGRNVSDVTVVFTDRGPTISGTVDLSREFVTFGARLYVFPTDEHYWSDCGSGPPRLRWATVGTDGRFKVGALPPGEYFVAATIGGEENWIKRDFLQSLVPFATRLKLALGDNASISLKPRPRR
jgi:protocatechuate 3,4-dioxygenase beta subunit